MTTTDTRFDDAIAPVAVASRSGLDESLHHGAGVALDADGSICASVGDPDLAVYPRSALKPMQAQAMVELGLSLPPELLAVVCASHSGEAIHLDAARQILELHGLTEGDLANTPTYPYDEDAKIAACAAGIGPSSLQQNCSGKHAGMLAACLINDWPTTGYLDIEHPLQQAITSTIARLADAAIDHVGIDGCGAPTHVMTLRQLARSFAELSRVDSASAEAMRSRPDLVGGTRRDVTTWMRAIPGLIAKEGAAGVMAAALPDGRAMAFKIADGSDAARRAVTTAGLAAMGVDLGEFGDAVTDTSVAVLGHGLHVGEVRALNW